MSFLLGFFASCISIFDFVANVPVVAMSASVLDCVGLGISQWPLKTGFSAEELFS